jgi:hypothetical protein
MSLVEIQKELRDLTEQAHRGVDINEARFDLLLRAQANNPEYKQIIDQEKLAWRESVEEFSQHCLERTRSFIPVNIFQSSQDDLIGLGIQAELAKRIVQRQCLWLVRMSKVEIARLHESDLMGRFNSIGQQLDIIETAAIYATLPDKFSADPSNKKQSWRDQVEDNLRQMLLENDRGNLGDNRRRHPTYEGRQFGPIEDLISVRENKITSGKSDSRKSFVDVCKKYSIIGKMKEREGMDEYAQASVQGLVSGNNDDSDDEADGFYLGEVVEGEDEDGEDGDDDEDENDDDEDDDEDDIDDDEDDIDDDEDDIDDDEDDIDEEEEEEDEEVEEDGVDIDDDDDDVDNNDDDEKLLDAVDDDDDDKDDDNVFIEEDDSLVKDQGVASESIHEDKKGGDEKGKGKEDGSSDSKAEVLLVETIEDDDEVVVRTTASIGEPISSTEDSSPSNSNREGLSTDLNDNNNEPLSVPTEIDGGGVVLVNEHREGVDAAVCQLGDYADDVTSGVDHNKAGDEAVDFVVIDSDRRNRGGVKLNNAEETEEGDEKHDDDDDDDDYEKIEDDGEFNDDEDDEDSSIKLNLQELQLSNSIKKNIDSSSPLKSYLSYNTMVGISTTDDVIDS